MDEVVAQAEERLSARTRRRRRPPTQEEEEEEVSDEEGGGGADDEARRVGHQLFDAFSHVAHVDASGRFCGHVNSRTDIKEAAFAGQRGGVVVGGSDDGFLYLWERSGALLFRAAGDGHCVNAAQPHPSLSAVAVSGFDPDVKLFEFCVGSREEGCDGEGGAAFWGREGVFWRVREDGGGDFEAMRANQGRIVERGISVRMLQRILARAAREGGGGGVGGGGEREVRCPIS
jgi:hypothetical protein